jgi:hypothetical protein
MRQLANTAVAAFVLTAAVVGPSAQSGGFDGKQIFRFDTFGDEQLWTDTLQMQHAIADVSPAAALAIGLKVDSDALPPAVIQAVKAGQVNLDDPQVTIQLSKLNAVVGVIGKVVGANDIRPLIGNTWPQSIWRYALERFNWDLLIYAVIAGVVIACDYAAQARAHEREAHRLPQSNRQREKGPRNPIWTCSASRTPIGRPLPMRRPTTATAGASSPQMYHCGMPQRSAVDQVML